MQPEIENILIKDFENLPEESQADYMFIVRALPPKQSVEGKKAKVLESMTFGEVSVLKQSMSSQEVFKVVSMVYDMEIKALMGWGVFDFFSALYWVRDCLNSLVERESKLLSSEPDQDLALAGIDELSRFGDQNIMIDLSERFGCFPQEIANLQYSQVFTILWRDNIMRKVQKTVSQIKTMRNG